MDDDRISALVAKLGYKQAEMLPTGGANSAVSLRCAADDGRQHVVRLWRASSKEFVRGKNASHGVYGTATYQTYLYSTGGANHAKEEMDSKILESSLLRWEVGEKSRGKATNRILSYGCVSDYLYECREFYPMTLADLLERQVLPNHSVLCKIVDQLWSSLVYLHDAEVNIPHGALHPGNVGITAKSIVSADFIPLDISDTPETRRMEYKRRDYQYLGLLIYRLSSSIVDAVDPVDAAARCKNASWPHLGKFEQKWKNLVTYLLGVTSHGPEWNPAMARAENLSGVMGGSVSLDIPYEIYPVTGEAPFVSLVEEESGVVADFCYSEKATEAWEHGDVLQAFELLQECPESAADAQQCVELADRFVMELPDEWTNQSELMSRVEVLANRGSAQCMLLLGRMLVKSEPGEALQWLGKAADHGLREAMPIMAGIYEMGAGETASPEPLRAAALYRDYLNGSEVREMEIMYRLAALILREPPLSDQLAVALRLLEEAHQEGHFQSTDLLAQCHAHGHGTPVDEKKAFQLFADAWNKSKKAGKEYYTASNNLGVCFAIGFGVPKGLTMARHYFRQGEIVGHEASKRNLLSLAQLG